MKHGKDMLAWFFEATSRAGEPVFRQPLIELCGKSRLLIEHHQGIGEYSTDTLCVKVQFGTIQIIGTNLQVCKMTEEQLIVIGNIDAVTLLKG